MPPGGPGAGGRVARAHAPARPKGTERSRRRRHHHTRRTNTRTPLARTRPGPFSDKQRHPAGLGAVIMLVRGCSRDVIYVIHLPSPVPARPCLLRRSTATPAIRSGTGPARHGARQSPTGPSALPPCPPAASVDMTEFLAAQRHCTETETR